MSTMNRLATTKNPFQTDAKKVLCCCSAGLLRSPTMANVLHKEFGYNTRVCGLTKEYALIPIDDVLVHWADEIVVAESWMVHEIENRFDVGNIPVLCLSIPDDFEWMDPKLQELIKERYKPILAG